MSGYNAFGAWNSSHSGYMPGRLNTVRTHRTVSSASMDPPAVSPAQQQAPDTTRAELRAAHMSTGAFTVSPASSINDEPPPVPEKSPVYAPAAPYSASESGLSVTSVPALESLPQSDSQPPRRKPVPSQQLPPRQEQQAQSSRQSRQLQQEPHPLRGHPTQAFQQPKPEPPPEIPATTQAWDWTQNLEQEVLDRTRMRHGSDPYSPLQGRESIASSAEYDWAYNLEQEALARAQEVSRAQQAACPTAATAATAADSNRRQQQPQSLSVVYEEIPSASQALWQAHNPPGNYTPPNRQSQETVAQAQAQQPRRSTHQEEGQHWRPSREQHQHQREGQRAREMSSSWHELGAANAPTAAAIAGAAAAAAATATSTSATTRHTAPLIPSVPAPEISGAEVGAASTTELGPGPGQGQAGFAASSQQVPRSQWQQVWQGRRNGPDDPAIAPPPPEQQYHQQTRQNRLPQPQQQQPPPQQSQQQLQQQQQRREDQEQEQEPQAHWRPGQNPSQNQNPSHEDGNRNPVGDGLENGLGNGMGEVHGQGGSRGLRPLTRYQELPYFDFDREPKEELVEIALREADTFKTLPNRRPKGPRWWNGSGRHGNKQQRQQGRHAAGNHDRLDSGDGIIGNDNDHNDNNNNNNHRNNKDAGALRGRGRRGGFTSQEHCLAWMPELLWCVFSLVCIGAIVGVLYLYDGHSLSDWPLGISLNALVAFLATLCRAGFVVPVVEGLAQLKWNWFARGERALSDVQVYENAARSPLGSARLLFSSKGR
jgi:hypothetical protein